MNDIRFKYRLPCRPSNHDILGTKPGRAANDYVLYCCCATSCDAPLQPFGDTLVPTVQVWLFQSVAVEVERIEMEM